MSTVLKRSGAGKVLNSFLPQAIYDNSVTPPEQITEIIIVIEANNSNSLEKSTINITVPRNEYYAKFKVGDEVLFEEYFTPISYDVYIKECNKLNKQVKSQEEFNKMNYGQFTYELQHLV